VDLLKEEIRNLKIQLEEAKRRAGGVVPRAKIDENVIAEYADRMKEGDSFPPVAVFHDGLDYYLADGFHRFFAAKKVGSPGILCDVKQGTLRDAILYSFGANNKHGLQRTAADKRKAVTAMLEDIEWQDWSDREIARQCEVSHPFVAAMRKELNKPKAETKMNIRGKETSRVEKPKQEEEEQIDEAAIEQETIQAAITELQKSNEDLQDQLTVAMAASTDDIQKEKAESIIRDLRAQIRLLEIELKAVTISRDQFQAENAQLMKQVAMLQKKLKKIEVN
jgi:hypothetical protein